MNEEDAKVPAAVAALAEQIAAAIEEIASHLRRGGRLVYLGAGTSGRLGVLDAAECPPTFGTDPGQVLGILAGGPEALWRAREGAEDREDDARQDVDDVGIAAADVVVGISASGHTPYTVAGLRHARERGALTIALCCNPGTPLAGAADLPLVVETGAEILTGSTRLKAGTATKLVLNMLSTGAMVRLGRTCGNLMSDLRPGSEKLVARAAGIVATLTGLAEAEAAKLLRRCNGEVRTAVAMHRLQLGPEAARVALDEDREHS
jgi:N-acetylmuramic acid 6-phosphate etherase